MLGVNLGTGTIEKASALVEYCNAPAGTRYADMRVAHGYCEPHGVKYWCLGNEMDGPWQIGHPGMHAYARKAREAAKLMKWHDPSIKLVLCGSSNDRMPTFPDWDRVALETCWEHVDYLSIHYYATNLEDDTLSYLATAKRLEDFVDTLAGTLRFVKAKIRSKHNVHLSWDEWQVWYKDRSGHGGWTEAPHLSEEIYDLQDALVVGQWLNVFLRKCGVLKIACVAQIVNVISWMHTRGDRLLRHPSFWPFKWVSNHARGNALDVLVRSPLYQTKQYGDVPVLDVSASHDPATRTGAVFVVNRSLRDEVVATIVWQGDAPQAVKAGYQLSGDDPRACNTFDKPDTIKPKTLRGLRLNGNTLKLKVPPLSFTALTFA
jgi:alpha-N-arabinofuranosidase